MEMNYKHFILLTLLHFTYNAYAGFTDCERPPTIANGQSQLESDDNGVVVMALYSCSDGYQLQGESTVYCDTGTDVWQDPPSCQSAGASEQSSATTPANVNKETVQFNVEDPPVVTHMESAKTDISAPASIAVAPEPANIPTTTPQQKRRRKPKLQNIPEDTSIDVAFASQLDLSCVGEEPLAAPSINDGYIHQYDRMRRGEIVFLVASYDCVEGFVLENPQQNRMYCSNDRWIGATPGCVSTGIPNFSDTDGEYGNGNESDEDEDEDEDEDDNEVDQNSHPVVQEEHETSNKVATENDINGAGNAETITQYSGNAVDVPQTNTQFTEATRVVEPSPAEIVCVPGMYPDPNGNQNCIDINECDNPQINELCEFGCQNTIGSYHCLPSPTTPKHDESPVEITISKQNTLVDLSPIKACGDGFRMNAANQCVDIDECVELDTGCQHCKNTEGGYECICPDGFQLAKDDKTCEDIDECTMYTEYVYDDNENSENEHVRSQSFCSFECVNTIGSFFCKCPENHHLKPDKRTCERDFCQHLGEIETNKTKCSHQCVDQAEGYRCLCPDGLQLANDQKTCVLSETSSSSVSSVATSGCTEEMEDQCSPGECVSLEAGAFQCSCPKGYASQSNRCIDFDECLLGTHNCSHDCRNIDGAYVCECPPGFQLTSDQHTCASAEICLQNPGICGNLVCQSSTGSYECVCPKGKELSQDGTDCVTVNLCHTGNGGCSHFCNVVGDQIVCECPSGYKLAEDRRTCQPATVELCSTNNGGCAQVCNPKLNQCECYPGFQTVNNGKTCIDVDECQNANGGCPQKCINSDGGFECACFPGFRYDQATNTCVDIDECLFANGNCDHQCGNTVGSYTCSCRSGFRSVGNHCEDVNECQFNNGNCSHTCANLNGSYQCTCPEGFKLQRDRVTCMEIKDNCQSFPTPENGDARCTRSRHRTQLFYKTKCTITCNEGYKLVGPPVKYCNGSGGTWDEGESVCVPTTCPALQRPRIGNVAPPDCYIGKIKPGGICALECPAGYRPADADFLICDADQRWSANRDLYCVDGSVTPTDMQHPLPTSQLPHSTQYPEPKRPEAPQQIHTTPQTHINQVGNSGGRRVKQGQTYAHGVKIEPTPSVVSRTGAGRSLLQPSSRFIYNQLVAQPSPFPTSAFTQTSGSAPQVRRVGPNSIVGSAVVPSPINGQIVSYPVQRAPIIAQAPFTPYIRCPRDTTIVLQKNRRAVEVNLEQPKTNVDWKNFVDAHPPWAKNLRIQLGIGTHTFSFRARSPFVSNITDVCQTVITVKESVGLEVTFCPQTIEVQLQPNELYRSVAWRDPEFSAQRPLKSLYRSHAPGTQLGVGNHQITYVATSAENQRAKCEFTVSVRSSAFARVTNANQGNHLVKPLANHDSFLICPGRPALKLDTDFPIQLPNGCFVKNVLINHHNRLRRRHSLGSHNMLRYYSSWDQPNFSRSSNYYAI